MRYFYLASALLAAATSVAAEFTVPPPNPAKVDEQTTKACTSWVEATAQTSEYCKSVAEDNGVEFTVFLVWNPSVGPSCNNMKAGNFYCVQENFGLRPNPEAFQGIEKQPELVPVPRGRDSSRQRSPKRVPNANKAQYQNCDKWHRVDRRDTLKSICQEYHITPGKFIDMNPACGKNGNDFASGDLVCVGLESDTQPQRPSKTGPSRAIKTPEPHHPMIEGCTEFYKIESGDTMWALSQTLNLDFAEFMRWNKQNSALQIGYHICAGLEPLNEPEEPRQKEEEAPKQKEEQAPKPKKEQPPRRQAQENKASRNPSVDSKDECLVDDIYTVVSGDDCWKICTSRGLDLNEFRKLNPGIENIDFIVPGQQLCVGKKFSRNQGDNLPKHKKSVMEPLRRMPGQPPNCNKHYIVRRRDIAMLNGLSVDQLKTLNPDIRSRTDWASTELCVDRAALPAL